MRYDKIIEYANSKSLVVSEAPNSGLKMNYEVGDVHINLFIQPKNSEETWFAGYIHYAKYDKGKKYEFEIPKFSNSSCIISSFNTTYLVLVG